MKKILAVLGFAAVIVLGMVQFATEAKADRPPIDSCAAVLCIVCPDGYVAAPTPGNCCHCVKTH
jgi:hypothetical protein